MTQDTVNEAQAIRNIAQALEKDLIIAQDKLVVVGGEVAELMAKRDEIREKLDDALNRIIELRELIDRMVEEVPSLNSKFKEDIDRLND